MADLTEQPAGLAPSSADSERPVFLVGMARSGTTLLRTTIGLHPRVHMSDEAHFIGAVARLLRSSRGAGVSFDEAWRAAETKRLAKRFPGVRRDAVEEALAGQPVTASRLFRAVLTVDAEPSGKPRWGGKVPLYLRPIANLLRWFPEARIVWIVRDPRATVASASKKRWGRAKGFRRVAIGWRMLNHGYARSWYGDPRVLFVRYEDLVTDWHATVETIARFIGEEADDRMLNPAVDDVRLNSSFGGRTSHPETAVVPDRNESWRKTFSRDEIWLIENATRDAMRHFRYQPIEVGTSPLRDLRLRTRWALRDVAHRLPLVRKPAPGRPRP